MLTFLAALLVSYGVGSYREAARKDAAFEATRNDARRFADAVVAQDDTRPVDRQDVEAALASVAGMGYGRLFAVDSAEGSTRVTIELSRMYQRSVVLFGPAETMVDRCFTITFGDSAQGRQTRITPHGSDESCVEVAKQGQ
ncbi:hypothetical protein [Streptomyces flaveus]|uniref:Uncharacterized protein n=1 Tax=Streptomyces flaveus TaxID=66370 RepID=A0A917R2L6_9ACTN|nr:hypothetical protein [Streptomyces flaveus]GGK86099.1 hypothetical protein GCM10010094_54210 [Streptomyces flaveus]